MLKKLFGGFNWKRAVVGAIGAAVAISSQYKPEYAGTIQTIGGAIIGGGLINAPAPTKKEE